MPKPVKFGSKPTTTRPSKTLRFDTSFDFGFNTPAKKGGGKKKGSGAAGGS
jgi:hypothetical protein